MIIVNCTKSNEVVSVKINISGLINWRYLFKSDDYKYEKTYKDGNVNIHSIGFPNEIDNEKDYVEIDLVNLSNTEQSYKIEITWVQDGKDLSDKFIFNDKLNPNETRVILDSAWIMCT